MSLQTNYLAPVLLNRLLLPKLKSNPSGSARIVHVTCDAALGSKVTPDTMLDGRDAL